MIFFALVTTCILLFIYAELAWGISSIKDLKDCPVTRQAFPKLSIVVCARDEEAAIGHTLDRLKALDYPHFEIICVNDRSSDQTGQIINEYAEQDARIIPLHLTHLPAGWMGKNHAAYCGSKVANGEWFLFLDADLTLETDTLTRMMSHVLDNQLDHVTALTHYHCSGFFYQVFHLAHKSFGYMLALKPWMARFKWSNRSINIGHFCLFSRASYARIGGHAAVAMECLEDVRMGELVKKHGLRQEAISTQHHASIVWYHSWQDMFVGIRKNSFAFFHYHLTPLLLGTIAWCLLFILPFIAVFFTRGDTQLLFGISCVLLWAMSLETADFFNISRCYAICLPVGLIAHLFPVYASVFYFYKHKGVYWRGTYYAASSLKS